MESPIRDEARTMLKKFQIGKLRIRKVSGKWVWLWNGKHFKFGSDSSGR